MHSPPEPAPTAKASSWGRVVFRSTVALTALLLLGAAGLLAAREFVLREGVMPAREAAVAAHESALEYGERLRRSPDEPGAVPAELTRLRPRKIEAVGTGTLVIFQSVWVEDSGYYYARPGEPIPAHLEPFLSSVGENVYRYHDPG